MNERGFTTIAMVIFFPFLIAVLASLSALFLLLRADAVARHTCRTDLLLAQENISQDLTSLLSLNPEATALRARRKLAEAQVAASGAAAMPALQAVVALQVALSARQKVLITKAKLLSRVAPSKTLASINESLSQQRGRKENVNFQGSVKVAHFNVVASPPTSLTPNYAPSSGFSRDQEMLVKWNYEVSRFLPQWLVVHVPSAQSMGLKAKAACSATLTKGLKWEPKITMAKH